MSRVRLPPMQALQAFDAVARTGSVSKAAIALHLTHGAISHQLRTLEEWVGSPLVARSGRGIRLTRDGERFASRLQPSLAGISEAVREIGSGTDAGELRVSVMSSFASRWLLPRIARYVDAHPEVDLHLRSTSTPEYRPEEMDLAIYYGDGAWRGASAEVLLEDRFSPVCSAALGRAMPKRPADLAGFRLLRTHWEAWTPWFRAARLDWPEPASGPLFEDSAHMLQAVEAGHGIALARRSLCADELRAGRLVQPFSIHVPAERNLYLLSAAGERQPAKAAAFRAWLLSELGASEVARAVREDSPGRSPAGGR